MTIPLLAALVLFGACHRPQSFVQSLRCGMTREQVRQLARRHGYNNSNPTWLARHESTRSNKLSFVDLTFRGERLVAYRLDQTDPRTRRIEHRDVDLCRGQSFPLR